jgi:hypothetical protein
MKMKNRNWILMGFVIIAASGCAGFNHLSSTNLTKVNCREDQVSKPSQIAANEQKDSSENNFMNLLSADMNPNWISPIVIGGFYIIKKLPVLSFQDAKSTKISNRYQSILNNNTTPIRLNSAKKKQYSYNQEKNGTGENEGYWIFAIVVLVGGLLILLIM